MLFGTIESTSFGKSPVSCFRIDDEPSHWEFVQEQTDVPQYQQKFFESPELALGTHILIVVISSVPSSRAHFTFDYAEYHASDISASLLSPFATPFVLSAEQKSTQTSPIVPSLLMSSSFTDSLEVSISSRNVYSKKVIQPIIKMNDRDPAISYSVNGWSYGGNSNEYQGTTRRTNKLGVSMTIPFTGSKVMLFGTIDSAALGTSPTPSFSIDNGPAQQVTLRQTESIQYQQKFYESPDLDAGSHVLMVTIVRAPTDRAHFTFDYVKFYPPDIILWHHLSTTITTRGEHAHTIPSEASSMSASSSTFESPKVLELIQETYNKIDVQHVIRLDDRNPIISYSPDCWSLGGNQNEYLGTTSRTHSVGASMHIPFTGTKIMVFGTIDALSFGKSPVSLFSIDNGRGQEFVQKQTDDFQYDKKFYESPDLTPGPHVLAVMISSAPSSRAHFTFDYAEYYPSEAMSLPPSTNASFYSATAAIESTSTSKARAYAIGKRNNSDLYDENNEKEEESLDSSASATGRGTKKVSISHFPTPSQFSLSESLSSVSSPSTPSSGRSSPTMEWCLVSGEPSADNEQF
ncbi:hypothetical protein CVT25_015878 [Psilocybe cyanescens]|uniref:Uncharacterized protein n=1 Tax=Psilocybe cyanescens TaxID=93625 RepID=A0A409XII3_PSICY|nr:hypothetical protein CVT25_015878 [Psilocybe cyanescens]